MKRLCLLVLAAVPWWCLAAAHDHSDAINACIGEYSGAESINCLIKIANITGSKIDKLERQLIKHASQSVHTQDLGQTHYQMAVSALHSASRAFNIYADHQCNSEIGQSGAVASGSGQVYWSCRIQLNDDRIAHLQRLLTKK